MASTRVQAYSSLVPADPETGQEKSFEEAVRPTSWQVKKDCAMTLLCIADFVSDVVASQSNAHSEHDEIQALGYIGAGLLLVSVMVNTCIVSSLRRSHQQLFTNLVRKVPVQWQLFRLISSTNPEGLNSFFVLCAQDAPAPDAVAIQFASQDVRRFALVSQFFEDIPQFTIQAASLVLSLANGWKITLPLLLSVGLTLTMLLGKVITNMLVIVLASNVSSWKLQQAAAEELRHVDALPSPSNAIHISFQTAITLGNISFLCAAGHLALPFVRVDGRTVFGVILLLSYILAVAFALLLVWSCRDRMWHCLLKLELSACLVALSSLHPATLLQAAPELHNVAGIWWYFLLVGPMLRCATMASLAAWSIWKSSFPVSENLCIVLLVSNVLGIIQLLAFIEDTEAEVRAVSTLAELAVNEEELQKLLRKFDSFRSELRDCSLAQLPDLIGKYDAKSMASLSPDVGVLVSVYEAFTSGSTGQPTKQDLAKVPAQHVACSKLAKSQFLDYKFAGEVMEEMESEEMKKKMREVAYPHQQRLQQILLAKSTVDFRARSWNVRDHSENHELLQKVAA